MKTLVLMAAVAVGLSACATQQVQTPETAQPAVAATFNPAGTYDFTAEVQGTPTPVRGVLTLRRDDQGALVGNIASDALGDIALQTVRLDGRRAEARAAMPDGELIFRMEFHDDDTITGGYETSGGVTGSFTGTRRP